MRSAELSLGKEKLGSLQEKVSPSPIFQPLTLLGEPSLACRVRSIVGDTRRRIQIRWALHTYLVWVKFWNGGAVWMFRWLAASQKVLSIPSIPPHEHANNIIITWLEIHSRFQRSFIGDEIIFLVETLISLVQQRKVLSFDSFNRRAYGF